MKRLLIPSVLAAVLSGCAVVTPYEQPDIAYSPATGYAIPPAVVYEPPVYVGPPVQFSFGFNYWHGGRHGGPWHDGHFHGFGNHGFRHGPPGHGGWHGFPGRFRR
jgi:hypothetical protein